MGTDTIHMRRWRRVEYERMLGVDDSVAPVAAPGATLFVAELLPRRPG